MKIKTTMICMLRYMAVFIISLLVLSGLLFATEFIPKEAMKENMLSSAEYMCEKEVFFNLHEGIISSKIDRYADSILLSIAYQTDRQHPVKATMWSSYYSTFYANENDNLLASVTKDLPANQQYMRYWHGSAVFVRLFHLFTDIRGMYLFHAVLLSLLVLGLMAVLIKEGHMKAAVALILGAIGISIWYVPFSLEYTWTFLLGFEAMFAAFFLWKKKMEPRLGFFFMITGILTAYFDFLTTETLPLTLPLLLLIELKKDEQEKKGMYFFVIKKAIAWGIGYVGMWVMKWIMSAVILQENVLPYVTEHIAERMGTTAPEYIPFLDPLYRNIICLFPMMFGSRFDTAVLIVFIAFCVFLYLFRKRSVDRTYVLCLAGIGILPWIRFLVLRNHAFLHYFFTYRAQLVTVMALCLITCEMLDWRSWFHGRK